MKKSIIEKDCFKEYFPKQTIESIFQGSLTFKDIEIFCYESIFSHPLEYWIGTLKDFFL